MLLGVAEKLKSCVETALTFLYPDVCQHCYESRATQAEGYVCSKCWGNVRFIVPPICDRCGLPFEGEISDTFECANCRQIELHFTSARSSVAAKGMVLDIIHRWKYSALVLALCFPLVYLGNVARIAAIVGAALTATIN